MARFAKLSSAILGLIFSAAPVLAWSDGAADGDAGLVALKGGDWDRAILAFTRALGAGDLAPDDQELAYLGRGEAWLAKGDREHAEIDLRRALALKPSDIEAQAALRRVLGQGETSGVGGRTHNYNTTLGTFGVPCRKILLVRGARRRPHKGCICTLRMGQARASPQGDLSHESVRPFYSHLCL